MRRTSRNSDDKDQSACLRCGAGLDNDSGFCMACGHSDNAAAHGKKLAATEAAHQRNLAGRARARRRGPFRLLEAFIRWIINRE